MDDLQPTAQGFPLLKLNHEVERIAARHEQAALNPDTCLAYIQNLARCRESPSPETATASYFDT